MAIFSHQHHHWAYVWIPVVGAVVWCGTLVAMIATWAGQGRPIYVSEDGTIPFISDIGADILKPLFIVGGSITAVSFFLSLVTERWLRHTGRLIPNMRRREKVFNWLAVLGALIGGAGLVLLTIFDTKRHPRAHRGFLLMFMVGVALSALFTIIEYRWISKDFAGFRTLRHAYIAKGVIAGILIILAIAFGVLLTQSGLKADNADGILEWVIAIGFTFYLLTFWYDLRMAKGAHKGQFGRERLMAERGSPGTVRPSYDTNGTLGTANGHGRSARV